MSVEDLINNVVDQDFAKAGPTFHELMQGYIQDVGLTNGLARYTANFTPPAALLEG